MRWFHGALASLLLGVLVAACNTVDPDECWPNTSGGFGGEGTIPIGAGVGATSSGDFLTPPPKWPLDNGGAPDNPCVTHESPAVDSPPKDGTEQGTYIRCLGVGSTACAQQCNAIGAYCVEHAVHPENPSVGIGDLKQCMSNFLSSTCSYCYSNGDVCTFLYVVKGIGVGGCTNTGGKGCE
jgi:hypothetical protein